MQMKLLKINRNVTHKNGLIFAGFLAMHRANCVFCRTYVQRKINRSVNSFVYNNMYIHGHRVENYWHI